MAPRRARSPRDRPALSQRLRNHHPSVKAGPLQQQGHFCISGYRSREIGKRVERDKEHPSLEVPSRQEQYKEWVPNQIHNVNSKGEVNSNSLTPQRTYNVPTKYSHNQDPLDSK
ncbi:hypothetical protein DV515_00012377 [Chloebia gouldiae]|uniref:Uncharacterized protein n=1 Tax=Chloebia gouldiae TaxID=44316 RepID=A0A3L8S423_CHLGU|nr:hypothetical protein DV515_00012377 [Chloebia gouldiae]